MKKEIEKLDISLIKEDKELLKDYNKNKAEYIIKNGCEYAFWGRRSKPEKGEAMWDNHYPNGFEDWKIRNGNSVLTSYGNQMIIDKINEIISCLNKFKK